MVTAGMSHKSIMNHLERMLKCPGNPDSIKGHQHIMKVSHNLGGYRKQNFYQSQYKISQWIHIMSIFQNRQRH